MNPLFDLISPILDKILAFIPNPLEREKVRLEQTQALLAILAKADSDQAEINKTEAASPNLFVSGWRPGCAWVCVIAYAWAYVLQPVIISISVMCGHPLTNLPVLDIASMSPVLMGLLGLGALRSIDKYNGVAKN